MNKVLGQGTSEPGLHVTVTVVPSLGRYLPDRDTPVYGDNTGPHCYPVPFTGITLHDGTSSPSSASSGASAAGTAVSASTGPDGAPQDSELVREVAALELGRPPSAVPGWSSLLLGPLYRGATVDLR
jgi:phospholipid/cholesterol/gamma-HCH transport system substrate-binding protein